MKWLLNTLSEYGQEGVRATDNGVNGAKGVWDQGALKDVRISINSIFHSSAMAHV